MHLLMGCLLCHPHIPLLLVVPPQIDHLRALSGLDCVASLLEVYEDADAVHLVLECVQDDTCFHHSFITFLISLLQPTAGCLCTSLTTERSTMPSQKHRRLCGGGDLYYLVRGTQLTEEQVKPLALQILQARTSQRRRQNRPRTVSHRTPYITFSSGSWRMSTHPQPTGPVLTARVVCVLSVLCGVMRRRSRSATPAESATET